MQNETRPKPARVVRSAGRNRQTVRPQCASRGGGRGSRGGRMGRGVETSNVNQDSQADIGRGRGIRGRGIRGGGRGRGSIGDGPSNANPTPSSGPLTDEQEHYLRQDEEALREFLEEEHRAEQEYLKQYLQEQQYEARMDWMHPSHWQSDEESMQAGPANNPTQPTQQSGIQQVQESVNLNQSTDNVQDVQMDDATISSTKYTSKRPMTSDKQPDEVTPPIRKQNKDAAPPLRTFVKQRGRSERIANQKKLFKFDDKGTGSTPDLAFDVSP